MTALMGRWGTPVGDAGGETMVSLMGVAETPRTGGNGLEETRRIK
jgi:hypothetical protein